MATKILVLMCSPRKEGNTSHVTNWVVESATEAGAEVEVVDAAHLKYKQNGCIACMGCQKSTEYKCVIKDEATEVVARVPEFDVLVFATPVYWFGEAAQMKMILDRMYSLVKQGDGEREVRHEFDGMSLGLIATAGGDPEEGLEQVDALCQRVAHFFMEGRYHQLLAPFCDSPDETALDDDLKARAVAFGHKLTGVSEPASPAGCSKGGKKSGGG
jgi:multimeric flavodoxin WrbA